GGSLHGRSASAPAVELRADRYRADRRPGRRAHPGRDLARRRLHAAPALPPRQRPGLREDRNPADRDRGARALGAATPWEARAARVLDADLCPAAASGLCGARRYAVGSVALRAGRVDAAKLAFRQACDFEPGWCARAAKEQAVPWTPAERDRLERRARP